jgi:hypothetical protein
MEKYLEDEYNVFEDKYLNKKTTQYTFTTQTFHAALKNPIKLYPVPASDILNIELNYSQSTRFIIRVLNEKGILVLSKIVSNDGDMLKTNVNVNTLIPGKYTISVIGAKSRIIGNANFIKK